MILLLPYAGENANIDTGIIFCEGTYEKNKDTDDGGSPVCGCINERMRREAI